MINKNKIIVTVLIVLVFVIIGELVYFFYLQQTTSTKNTLLPQSENRTISGTFDFNKLNLLLLNKHISTSILTNEYVGKIIAVHPNPGIIPRPNISYEVALEILATTGTKPFWAYYSAKELPQIKVVYVVNKIERPIKFIDLKASDSISIIETYDVKKSLTTSIKIIKK